MGAGNYSVASRALGLFETAHDARVRIELIMLALCACSSTPVAQHPSAPAQASLYVVPQGGHTGIAVRRVDIPMPLLPEQRDFPGADYLEFGWGDREFYMAASPGPWLSFKAAFLPTDSVVHVAGVRGELGTFFAGAELLEVRVSRPALEGLLRYVHDAFQRRDGAAEPLGRGFYAGRDTFHLGRTCNAWTAGALRAAGLPVRDALTVEGILGQVRRLAVGALNRRRPSAARSPSPGNTPGSPASAAA
jgi:uncharacterized protein (TIGR02117 family)